MTMEVVIPVQSGMIVSVVASVDASSSKYHELFPYCRFLGLELCLVEEGHHHCYQLRSKEQPVLFLPSLASRKFVLCLPIVLVNFVLVGIELCVPQAEAPLAHHFSIAVDDGPSGVYT